MRLHHLKRYSSTALIAVLLLLITGCSLVSPPVGTRHEILNNPGLYIDLLALLFLVFMLWSSAKVRMRELSMAEAVKANRPLK